MAYIFYFLGFVSWYRISTEFAEEETAEWVHFLTALIWPIVTVLGLALAFWQLIRGTDET